MAKEIFKLQRPLVSTEPQVMVMIYNEDRSKEGFLPATPEVLDLFPEEPIWEEGLQVDPYKIFVYGTFHYGEIDIVEIAPWQDW